jgi:molybdopterin synthase catalytic subunit
VPLGEASVAIVTAAPHRAEAYAASRFLIEETKRRAPIWKKERLASGRARWVEGGPGGG